MGKNIGKNISENLKKIPEASGDLIGNKIADMISKSPDGRITKLSKNSQQNNSETVTN